jgi:hypothetical protein
MSCFKAVLVAGAASALTLGLIMLSFIGHVGGDGPDTIGSIGMFLLWPALSLAGYPRNGLMVPIVGFLEFFAIYFAVIMIWRCLIRRAASGKEHPRRKRD